MIILKLKEQSGSAMITAIIVAGVVMITSTLIGYQAVLTNRMSRVPRIKAEMMSLEQQIREVSMSPESYLGCNTVLDNDSVTKSSCQLNESRFQAVVRRSTIGIDLINLQMSDAGRITGRLKWTSTDLPIAPKDITIDVPKEVLQAQIYTCPDVAPIFVGIDSSGKIQCRPIPNSNLCNRAGQYISGLSKTTLEVTTCAAIPTSAACPVSQFLSRFEWQGGGGLNTSCSPRRNAFEYYKFAPVVAYATAQVQPALSDPVQPMDVIKSKVVAPK